MSSTSSGKNSRRSSGTSSGSRASTASYPDGYQRQLVVGSFRNDPNLVINVPSFGDDEEEAEEAYIRDLKELFSKYGRSYPLDDVRDAYYDVRQRIPEFEDGEEELMEEMFNVLDATVPEQEEEFNADSDISDHEDEDIESRLQRAADKLEAREKQRQSLIESTRAHQVQVTTDLSRRTLLDKLQRDRESIIDEAFRKAKRRIVFDEAQEQEAIREYLLRSVDGASAPRPIRADSDEEDEVAIRRRPKDRVVQKMDRTIARLQREEDMETIASFLERLPRQYPEGAERAFYDEWQDVQAELRAELPLEEWLNQEIELPLLEEIEKDRAEARKRGEVYQEEDQDDVEEEEPQEADAYENEVEGEIYDAGVIDANDRRSMRKRIEDRERLVRRKAQPPQFPYVPDEFVTPSSTPPRLEPGGSRGARVTGDIIGKRIQRPKEFLRLTKIRPEQRLVSKDALFRVITELPDNILPMQALFTDEQKEAIQNCCKSSGQLVVASTGFGKTSVILAVATSYYHKTLQTVLLIVKASTVKTFEGEIRKIDARYRPDITIRTKEFVAQDKIPPGDYKTILIDECQNFGTDTILNQKPTAAYYGIGLCAAADRVYLFSATPCSSEGSELKSLLYMVKRLRYNPSTFNEHTLTPYTRRGVLGKRQLRRLIMDDGAIESVITHNWRCLVSWYEHDVNSAAYKLAFVNLEERVHYVKMNKEELNAYQAEELISPWNDDFGSKLAIKCQTVSKYREMLRLLKLELTRFNSTPSIKPRIIIYAHHRKYAADIKDLINQGGYDNDEVLRDSNAILQYSSDFRRVNNIIFDRFSKDDGISKVCVLTQAGVTGFDPPRLTSIIAMNSFWIPTLQLQLAGRLNRRNKHKQFDDEGIEKDFYLHYVLASKRSAEEIENEAEDVGPALKGKLIRPYTFDTHQHAVAVKKNNELVQCMIDLRAASPQMYRTEDRSIKCSQNIISAKLRAEIKYTPLITPPRNNR